MRQPQRAVVVKIGLLDAAAPEADLPHHRGGQTIEDAGLHLRRDDAWVPRQTDIGDTIHLLDTDAVSVRIIASADFDHLRHGAAEGVAHRQSATAAAAIVRG